MVWRVLRLKESGATERQASLAVAKEFHVSPSTAKVALRLTRGRPQEQWLDLLTPAHKGRAKTKLDERIVTAFIADFGRVEQPTAQACYERVCRRAAVGKWGAVPPLKTLKRRFEELPTDVKRLMREGERSLLDSLPAQERDRSGKRPLDDVNMDSRIWDVRVQLGEGRVGRPVVTMIQDVATNFILGYEITEVESAASYRRVICQASMTYGIAGRYWFDNTRAAANKKLTAGAKGRHRFTDRADDIPGILPTLGAEAHFTDVRNGRAKHIERAFRDLTERSEKVPELAGCYTGRSPERKPANYGERAAPFDVFARVLAEAVDEYNSRDGRRSKVGPCYRRAFEAGMREVAVRRLTEAQRRLFFLVAERRTVSPAGTVEIRQKGEAHAHRFGFVDGRDELRSYAGREIVVRYDENDMSAAIVAETLDGRVISDAVPRIAPGGFNSAEAAGAHKRARAQVRKGAKMQAAAYARMDAIDTAEVAPAVAASPVPIRYETSLVRPTFGKRKPASAEPPLKYDLNNDFDLSREITRLSVEEADRRWGAA